MLDKAVEQTWGSGPQCELFNPGRNGGSSPALRRFCQIYISMIKSLGIIRLLT